MAAKTKELDELVGINARECCAECMPEICVITNEGVCGHPNKGGLQAKFMSNRDVLARYGRAKKLLAMQALEKRQET